MIAAIVLLSLCAFTYFKGYQHGREKYDELVSQQAVEAVRIAGRQSAGTVKVVTRYEKVKGETEVVTEVVEKEVIRYANNNPGVCLDGAWRVLHDAAATNTVPDTTGNAYGTSAAPAAATAIQTVTANYAQHHTCVDRLNALQEWVREMEGATNGR